MKIQIKQIEGAEDIPLPSYGHPGDAGLDLYAREEVTLLPGERKSIPTSIQMAIPDGYVGLIWEKSGLAFKHGIKTYGGVIDAGYRGEIMIGVMNVGGDPYTFERGHKVAQMLIQKVELVALEVVEKLDDTSRGEGGFGSTGK